LAVCVVVCAWCHRWPSDRRRAATTKGTPTPRRRRNAAYVRGILADTACVDCGETDPLVLDFDHVGDKNRNVSTLVYIEAGIDRLQSEIDECEVRCANCHRRQTAARGQHFRFRSA
jgi:hypothetical protein